MLVDGKVVNKYFLGRFSAIFLLLCGALCWWSTAIGVASATDADDDYTELSLSELLQTDVVYGASKISTAG